MHLECFCIGSELTKTMSSISALKCDVVFQMEAWQSVRAWVGGVWKVCRECVESVWGAPGKCAGSVGEAVLEVVGFAELSANTCKCLAKTC